TRNGAIGNTTIEASWSNPKPAIAFRTTPTKSSRVRMTVGMPLLSSLAATRPHAVAQAPQEALPMITASALRATTCSTVSSRSIGTLPIGNSVSGTIRISSNRSVSFSRSIGSMRCDCHMSFERKATVFPSKSGSRAAWRRVTSVAPDGSNTSRASIVSSVASFWQTIAIARSEGQMASFAADAVQAGISACRDRDPAARGCCRLDERTAYRGQSAGSTPQPMQHIIGMPPRTSRKNMTLDPETLSLLLDATRRLVDEKLIPAEAEADANGELPSDVVRAMREMGLFGLTVPASYGGLGLNRSEEVRFLFEFCRASPSFRSLLGTTVGVGGKSILLDGTEEQEAYRPRRIARGETIVSFCLTEPDSGSDAKALKTRARRDGDEWVIDGTKRFISNAPLAGLFVVMARTGERVTAFLVPAETPGIEVAKPWRKMGQRAADVADVAFENCRVPADSVLGGEAGIGRGFNAAMKALDDGRLHIAAVAVGLGRR